MPSSSAIARIDAPCLMTLHDLMPQWLRSWPPPLPRRGPAPAPTPPPGWPDRPAAPAPVATISRSRAVSSRSPGVRSQFSIRVSASRACVRCRASQFPARLRRGSRSAVGTPCTCRNASRGLASTNAACSALAPCNRSITPLTSCAVNVSRRVRASTASWLPAGNRTNCRASAGPTRPKRRSSFTATLSFSSSASRRHTQLLCWPSKCAASTCVSPSSRTKRLHDPGFLQLPRRTLAAVQPQDRRLRRPFVHLHHPHAQARQPRHLPWPPPSA